MDFEVYRGVLGAAVHSMLCPLADSCTMSAAKDAEWLRWVTKQFGNMAGKDKEINLEEFKTALQVKEVSAGTGSLPPGSTGCLIPSYGLLEKIKLRK